MTREPERVALNAVVVIGGPGMLSTNPRFGHLTLHIAGGWKRELSMRAVRRVLPTNAAKISSWAAWFCNIGEGLPVHWLHVEGRGIHQMILLSTRLLPGR